ncbi:uncharacterized protein Z520_11642 [Fonsecaea multimorphosa CBS 102226]|uniref:AAA+ ATPase domain-containing protein n=1 Tax=Fonsecaea multimorphosa CBS 102226 TaxID=1442371 RepID=A0A0D2K8E4_9EURO|nr:uncharacterized protein Z520_11642 [Fonsecaea multimorphosa CBS 102226]KIX92613.1 hypothetical protein Z520_11642 [Fonsecaea multimorphosa CBS 102226]OAL17916.1 hypothetical protein AYO22_11180 [Fonsecaea multimorphosa]
MSRSQETSESRKPPDEIGDKSQNQKDACEDSSLDRECPIIHRVYCTHPNVDGEDHSEHPDSADFLDSPRLYKNDHRASALRGRHQLPQGQQPDARNPVLVVRGYDCTAYHKTIRGSFGDVPSSLESRISSRVRPYACVLAETASCAEATSEQITISMGLSTALREYTKECKPPMGHWDPHRDVYAPYDYFYHFRHELRDRCAPSLPQPERGQLLLLLNCIDKIQGSKFDEIDRDFACGKVHRDTFSKLFAPNELIVNIEEDHSRAYIAETITITKRTITLDCWTWIFDGSFKKHDSTITVPWPVTNPEEVQISSLSTFPLRLDKTGLRERLVQRGRKFWSCRNRRLVSYNAPFPTIFELQVTNPKYMVDYKTYREIHPSQFEVPLASEREMLERGVTMDAEEPPNDDFSLLLPDTIVGYAFHDKKWRSLYVEHIEEVRWNEEAFSRLVLKSNKKDTIKALVSIHLTTVKNVDFVENKGNGLIMLLHGSPGTGKTLTAESVAEVAKKPLYRVTCGDVGTSAETVEKYLESVLLLGSIWECVVLLDEADVFLEERQVTDLARNALVSVFLRVLEYYDGILILTTNRVGTFDEAFKSRVQLAIHYPALNSEDRYEIWCNFIEALKEKKVSMLYEELRRKALVMARRRFNGRQIRNCLWTATQVAKYRNEPLGYSHIEQVMDISQEFEDYLEKTRGLTDEENAQEKGVRAFDPEVNGD